MVGGGAGGATGSSIRRPMTGNDLRVTVSTAGTLMGSTQTVSGTIYNSERFWAQGLVRTNALGAVEHLACA